MNKNIWACRVIDSTGAAWWADKFNTNKHTGSFFVAYKPASAFLSDDGYFYAECYAAQFMASVLRDLTIRNNRLRSDDESSPPCIIKRVEIVFVSGNDWRNIAMGNIAVDAFSLVRWEAV